MHARRTATALCATVLSSLSGPHLLLLRLLLDCHHQEGAGSSFVPNDCYLSPAANFLLVTGPNGAGKVYL